MTLKSTKKRLLVCSLVIICVALLYPFETAVVPLWRIQVIDQHANPIRGIGVREHWADYSYERSRSQQDLFTDENGYVVFPARTVKAGLIQRALNMLFNLAGGAHSSWGPHAGVMVLVNDSALIGFADWRSGEALPEQVIVGPLGGPIE